MHTFSVGTGLLLVRVPFSANFVLDQSEYFHIMLQCSIPKFNIPQFRQRMWRHINAGIFTICIDIGHLQLLARLSSKLNSVDGWIYFPYEFLCKVLFYQKLALFLRFCEECKIGKQLIMCSQSFSYMSRCLFVQWSNNRCNGNSSLKGY